MLLQLAAKLHEMMIVTSLSLVVLDFVRYELLFGDGLPLGLVGSGLTFNSPDFFFKKELYCTLKYIRDDGNKFRKFLFVIVVIMAGLTAALAGPSSAVLLVPKSQNWAAGGTQFYLNGSVNDFWPADLSENLSEIQSLCNRNDSTRMAICPAGGFDSLWEHWGSLNSSTFRTHEIRPYAKDLSGSNFYWPVSSPLSQVPPLYALGNSKNTATHATTLIQPHAAVVVVLQQLAVDWWKSLTSQKGMSANQVDDRIISADLKNAISVVGCAKAEAMSASDKIVRFPTIDGRFNFAQRSALAIDSLNNTATDHLRFQWVHLPVRFGAASIGAVFETPWQSNGTYRAVVGCTVQAGWVPATVFTDKYTFWTGWYPWNIQYGDRTPAWSSTTQSATNGRISLGDDWLDLLTPLASSSDSISWQPSTIESILLNAGLGSSHNSVPMDWIDQDSGSQDRLALIEAIICSVIVDGLSRTGSHRAFNTSGPSSQWQLANYIPLPDFKKRIMGYRQALEAPRVDPENLTTIEANMQISGFSFERSLVTYLAMTVLLTHVLMATMHTIYILYSKRTSCSWASVTELIALSQNSSPAFDVLANTSGGVESGITFSQMTKIRVKKHASNLKVADHEIHEHVELLFGNSTAPGHQHRVSQHELDELRNRYKHHVATWPLDIPRVQADADTEAWSILTPTDRLNNKEATDVVQPGHRYG
ncbi:hypothetical protein N7456_002604 [Penicillium angulare]|uniref:Uncharacterized protein n=1 Tax=Penicillium angulare TaxID=116970 RepID=A0A9W9G8E6_9EURO|nr:hypothetical protein N7456_002604 [Penicillium angulare]